MSSNKRNMKKGIAGLVAVLGGALSFGSTPVLANLNSVNYTQEVTEEASSEITVTASGVNYPTGLSEAPTAISEEITIEDRAALDSILSNKPLDQQVNFVVSSKLTNGSYVINYALGENLIRIAEEGGLLYFANVQCLSEDLKFKGIASSKGYTFIIPAECIDENGRINYFSGVRTGNGSIQDPFVNLASFREQREAGDLEKRVVNDQVNPNVILENDYSSENTCDVPVVVEEIIIAYPSQVTVDVPLLSNDSEDLDTWKKLTGYDSTSPTEETAVSGSNWTHGFNGKGIFGKEIRTGVNLGAEFHRLDNGNTAKDGFVQVSVDYPLADRLRAGVFGQYNGNTLGVNNTNTQTEVSFRERMAIGNPIANLYREREDSEIISEKTKYPWEAGANLSLKLVEGLEARFGAGVAQRVNYKNVSGASNVLIYQGNELVETNGASNRLPQEVSKSGVFSGSAGVKYSPKFLKGVNAEAKYKFRDGKHIGGVSLGYGFNF